jgi:hypothetical protein
MESAKEGLDAWKAAFEATHARKPSKEDLFGHPEASLLFQEFSQNSKKFS